MFGLDLLEEDLLQRRRNGESGSENKECHNPQIRILEEKNLSLNLMERTQLIRDDRFKTSVVLQHPLLNDGLFIGPQRHMRVCRYSGPT